MASKATTVSVERWTPTQAKEALGTNHVNRNLREAQVKKYTRDMEEGRWTFCPDPIAFDKKGNLINGQHRLNAQIAANKTIQWVVVKDAPDDTQKTMDSGAVRTLPDLLQFEGFGQARTLGAVAKLALQMATGMIYTVRTTAQLSNTEVLNFIRDNEELLMHATKKGQAAANNGFLKTKPSALAAAHWWIAQHAGIEEADNFFDRISAMTNEPEGSPVIALVKRLNELARQQKRIDARWVTYMVLKAWNYDVRKMPVYKLTATTKTGEYKLIIPLRRDASDEEKAKEDDE